MSYICGRNFLVVSCSNTVSVTIVYTFRCLIKKKHFVSHHFSCFWNCRPCQFQTPDANVSVPEISESLPLVGLAVASVDVDASLSSASGDLPGECSSLGFECFFLDLNCYASPLGYRGTLVMLVYETCAVSAIRTWGCILCSRLDIVVDRVYFVYLYLL